MFPLGEVMSSCLFEITRGLCLYPGVRMDPGGKVPKEVTSGCEFSALPPLDISF